MGAGFGGKGGILTVELRDQASLFKAYMPFVKGGGIFVATNRAHKIGEEVFVLLQLLEQREPIPVAAKVIWVSPAGSSTYKQGIGIQLGDDNRELMNRIETQLTEVLNSSKPTSTM